MADAADLTAPLEPPKPAVTLRAFDDIPGQRQAIYQGAKQAFDGYRPIENQTHALKIRDVDYEGEFNPTIADEKKTLMNQGRLHRPLYGTVDLVDRQTGKTTDSRRIILAHVPHLNSRGLFIHNGVPWLGRHQERLRPGAYTHQRKDGSTETQFNVEGGRGFRVQLEPKTGVFRLSVQQSNIKLYPILRQLGIPDDELKKQWGDDLFRANWSPASGHDQHDLKKLVQHLGRPKDLEHPGELMHEKLAEILGRGRLDPDTVKQTMGHAADRVTPGLIVQASNKILRVNRGETPADNRDSQSFQRILGPEDVIAERLRRDPGQHLYKALWKASRTGNLQHLNSGLLTPDIHALYNGTGLFASVEDINPAETHDLRQSITRLGEGGISSAQMVSREAQGVQPSYFGVIDPTRAPEGNNIGLDLRLTDNALKGSDGQLHGRLRDIKTGQIVTRSAREMASMPIAFPGELASGRRRIRVVEGERMRVLPRSKVQFELPSANSMFSRAINMVPMVQGSKGQRAVMGARMQSQALPLEQGEAPLVRSTDENGQDLHTAMSERMGARRAEHAGRVTKVEPGAVEIQGTDGARHTVELYDNYPLARKTFLTNTPTVKVGDTVAPGQMVARSNFTDDKGDLALGRNARVAYVVAKGQTYEDSIKVSESFAQKAASLHGYKHELDLGDNVKSTDTKEFATLYPERFTKDQLAKLGTDGTVKVGQTVNPGDPVIVGLGRKDARAIGAVMKGSRDSHTDLSQVWDHVKPGIVTDVHRTKTGIRVQIHSTEPLTVGSKLSNRYGGKGIVSEITPDAQMPHTRDGKPLEVLMSTMGLISRVNPSVAIETLLGKIAAKTGKPYTMRPFDSHGHLAQWALDEARKNGIEEREDLIDPVTGRKIPQVFTGVQHIMKLHHTAESKIAARDTGTYGVDDSPARGGPEGSKRVSGLDLGVLIAGGATDFLKDAKLVRGQRNDDFWRAIKQGETPSAPNHSFANDHFHALLKAAGVNLREHSGHRLQLAAMTDADVDRMAQHEITATGERGPSTFDYKTMKPIPGGLFDLGITGGEGGTRWSKIALPHKVPHPLFEEPIKRILGLSGTKFAAVMQGKEQLDGKTGPGAIDHALHGIDLDREIETAKQAVKTASRSTRDSAVKRLGMLAGLKNQDVLPGELTISKVPVLPPKYRPIVRSGGMDMINDANYLYHDLLQAKRNVTDAKQTFGDSAEHSWTLYNAVKALYGAGDPVSPQSQDMGVKGMLRFAIGVGDSSKFARYQRKVLGQAVDTVGRAVIATDPDLHMDQVGVPDEMAKVMFRPRVIQHLVQQGKPPAEAVKAVHDWTPEADRALDHVMSKVPVVYNRAPALHKFNYVSGWGKRRKDNAIGISPIVTVGLAGDHDGNCCAGWSTLTLTINAGVYGSSQETEPMRTAPTTKILTRTAKKIVVEMEIQHFPFDRNSGIVDKNGAITYRVPEGVEVLSYDEKTRESKFFAVTEFTVDPDKETSIVTTMWNMSVQVSNNESLVVYNHNTGLLEKVSPAAAVGAAVPVVAHLPSFGSRHDFGFGWMAGAFAGDGFASNNLIGFVKLDGATREYFTEQLTKLSDSFDHELKLYGTYHGVAGNGKLGASTKNHYGVGGAAHTWLSTAFYTVPKHEREGRSALYKCLPYFMDWSREARLGMLSGLLDTDGTVALNCCSQRPKPQLLVNYATSSKQLRDDLIRLCLTLGVRATYSTTKAKPGRLQKVDSYTVSISTGGLKRLNGEIKLRCARKQAILDAYLPNVQYDKVDTVPIPVDLMQLLCSAEGPYSNEPKRRASWQSARAKRGSIGMGASHRCSREIAIEVVSRLTDEQKSDPVIASWIKMVDDTTTRWDVVASAVPAETITTYDLGVPGPKVFAVNGGLVIMDTINLHVPGSSAAIRDSIEKMLPSKSLIHPGTFDVHLVPRQEFGLGLFMAGDQDKESKPRMFADAEQALKAYERGEIGVRDRVQILHH